ncbi:hypothetical protein Poli38472_013908 [Pythium oligandrum]|uniref:histone acetyltransferase n=1 Tax=Pythium oligandrum TaxID=41045 RepID=A0A8K1C2A7_PYTOL|nr:hypothetical protein Poli38472_013908 [Pythium oligandrum]|eukprot:TMW55146.1 hypothetical protein Poli38472_013908 [Pythium oligandrum]
MEEPLRRAKKRARQQGESATASVTWTEMRALDGRVCISILESESESDEVELVLQPTASTHATTANIGEKTMHTSSLIKSEHAPPSQSVIYTVESEESDAEAARPSASPVVIGMGGTSSTQESKSEEEDEDEDEYEHDEELITPSPVSMPSPPKLTPRKPSHAIIRRRRLDEEYAGQLLFYGRREPPTASTLALIIELIQRDVGSMSTLTERLVNYTLWHKLNVAVDRGLHTERAFYSEWMKIVLGSEDLPHRVMKHRQALLPRPIRLTVRPVQFVSVSKSKSNGSSDAKVNVRWLEQKAAKMQNGSARIKVGKAPSQPRRSPAVTTPTQSNKRPFSPVAVATENKRQCVAEPTARTSRSTEQRQSTAYSPSTSSSAKVAAPVLLDLSSDEHTTGWNRSMPVGWVIGSDRDAIDEAKRPVLMNPLYNMTLNELKDHISATRADVEVEGSDKLSDALNRLMADPRNRGGIFNTPVDPVALGLTTYNDIIKKPMDLGTIRSRLSAGQYVTPDEFAADVRLVFENAKTFNPPTHYVHVDADVLLRRFEDMMAKSDGTRSGKRHGVTERHSCSGCHGHTCALCDQGCLQFAPPHLQCSGSCGGEIRKGSIYYVTRDGTRVWCAKCHARLNSNGSLQESQEIAVSQADTAEIRQVYRDLIKKKVEVEVEPWVQCSHCSRWQHQICGLYNPVYAAYAREHDYRCPLCVWKQRSASGDLAAVLNSDLPEQKRKSSCLDIPACELSEFIEDSLREQLRAIQEHEAADSLHVRVLSFAGEHVTVPDSVMKTFDENATLLDSECPEVNTARQWLPTDIDFTSRGIYLFQRHDGSDICLFTLFVQEFGDSCSLPSNRRSVYIAYLDSIRYLKPPSARTASYHFIMMAYFDYIRRRGFERVHIWSCPPQKRTSYVFWCRPAFQRTPNAEHLRSWYRTLLMKAKTANIVKGWTTMYDRYFSPEVTEAFPVLSTPASSTVSSSSENGSVATRGASARSVDPNELWWPAKELPPLFEGDFLPSELDRILGRIHARNGKVRRSSLSTKSSSVAAGGKYAMGETVARIKPEPPANTTPQVEIKLRDVFVRCQQAVQRFKQDLWVVELVPLAPDGSSALTPVACDPAQHMPTWWQTVPRLFGSRFMFHQLCASATYQFDTIRRAKHSTMMMLHHFFNDHVPQLNVFCSECYLLITHMNYWHCDDCTHRFALCDLCYKRQGHNHAHAMTCTAS